MTHTEYLYELCTKAAQAAQMAADDVRQAHSACGDNERALEMLLIDAITDARKLSNRLAMIAACCVPPGGLRDRNGAQK
jgi:hypothetical protein